MFILLFVVLAAAMPVLNTWLFMLAIGNFEFAQFSFVDCIPAGVILAFLTLKFETKWRSN